VPPRRAELVWALVLGLGLATASADDHAIGSRAEVLSDGFRRGSFTQLHQVYPSRIVHRGGQVQPLPYAKQQRESINYRHQGYDLELDQYFDRAEVMGFLVLKDGEVVHESYHQGTTAQDRFTSWSMAKSVVSTLLGLAVADGFIDSPLDPATKYVPELNQSGYGVNSIRDLLQMTSGVEFIENYVSTDSLEAAAWLGAVVNHERPYNSTILWFDKRIAEPGVRFYYASIEPQVVGWVIRDASSKTLADYFSERIWQHIGAEHDAFWVLDRPGGMEIASCCISATLRDYARLGQLFLNNGRANGKQLVPEAWIATATQPDPERPFLHPGADSERTSNMGYQHYWWLWPGEDGAFSAIGFGGQELYINPAKQIVIVQTAAWGNDDGVVNRPENHAVFRAWVNELEQR
jgi:CubicO group peptidase (beta-lactamase class C family)